MFENKSIVSPAPLIGPDVTDADGAVRWWIGWQEWASLPDLGFDRLRVKIDTGAKTSSLHAWKITPLGEQEDAQGNRQQMLKLNLDGDVRNGYKQREIIVPLLRYALVTDSSGRKERRPVFHTRIALGSVVKTIEVNVTNRETMRFRMIIGRTCLIDHFLVDVNREFLLGPPVSVKL